MTVDAFLDIIKTDKTRYIYATQLKAFENWSGIRDFKTVDPKAIQDKLIEYVVILKKANKSYSGQSQPIYAIQKFCEAYDIEGINFKKIKRYRGENVVIHQDVPRATSRMAFDIGISLFQHLFTGTAGRALPLPYSSSVVRLRP